MSSRLVRLTRLLRHQRPVAALAAAAEARGVEAHLVGGVIRDRLLGLPSRDHDTVVGGAGREIATELAKTLDAHLVLLGGKAFAAYRLVARDPDDWVLDLWDRETMPVMEDLARRDFTINSIALPLTGVPGPAAPDQAEHSELIDPFGGLGDAAHRVLRATTARSFTGDPLRVLRLPRLLAQLPRFHAAPDTLALARRSAPALAGVAAERVREELALIVRSDAVHRAVGVMAFLGLYPGLLRGEPGAETGVAEERRAGHALLALEHLPERAREVRVAAPGAALDLPAARFALLFAAVPESGRSPQPAVERFRDAGYLTRDLAARVLRLLAADPIPGSGPEKTPRNERQQRRWLHDLGPLWATAVAHQGATASLGDELERWRARLAELEALLHRDGRRILEPEKLLSGDEIQRLLGIPPGPELGRALDRVRRAQVDGQVATKDEALALLKTSGLKTAG